MAQSLSLIAGTLVMAGSEESDDETVEHTFDVAGTYNVDLTVTDSTLQTASDSILITVEEPLFSPSPTIPEEPVCDPSYPDLCIPPPPPDLGCDDVSASNFEGTATRSTWV